MCRAGCPGVMSPARATRTAVQNAPSPRAGGGGRATTVRLPLLLSAALTLLVPAFAGGVHAQDGLADLIELSGRLSTEARLYPGSAVHDGQRSHASGFAAEATAYIEDDDGTSFTFTPFYRYDAEDPDRTHADVRDAYVLMYGDLGDDEWELRLGVDRVFWGVVESRPLVDIVNQTDLVEHPDEKTKLGQPMAHVTWSGEWGALELFGLTGHRARTFPGRHGRLRPSLVIDHDRTSYESSAEEWHVDLAGRFSGSFGPLDIGLSVFDGTSRDPTMLPRPVCAYPLNPACHEFVLAPYYEKIRQYGLDAQITTGQWLLKLEAIHRAGAQNRRPDPKLSVLEQFQAFRYEEEDYAAFITGVEYTINQVWESDADLSLIAEWAHDERGERATNAFESDVLLAARLGLNDEEGTEFTLSTLESLEYTSRAISAEFKRRLSDSWSLHVESLAYAEIEEEDVMYDVRRDSFIAVSLAYGF